MTIAACYVSTEGVVLGADSASTIFVPGRGNQRGSEHQFNFAQKVFEFGPPGSTAGIVFWGLGFLGPTSHRTWVAEAGDKAVGKDGANLEETAKIATEVFWDRYVSAYSQNIQRARELAQKGVATSEEEANELLFWSQNLSGGFCLGGRSARGHQPEAFEVQFVPTLDAAPEPKRLDVGRAQFWGCPNLIERLIYGMDYPLFDKVASHPKWTGTRDDLFEVLNEVALGQPTDLPLREAIDWVYASIYTTIKAMKFSHLAPVCGGPIEIAAISTDRQFRWVRHKLLSEAISAHETREDRP